MKYNLEILKPHIDITEYIAEHLCSLNYDSDFSRIAIIFGGKRPAIYLREHLARKINREYYPPVCYSVEGFKWFLSGVADKNVVEEMDAYYYLYQLVNRHVSESLVKAQSFADFIPWAHELLTFLNLLDEECIEDERLSTIEESARIGFPIPKKLNIMLESIRLIRNEFKRLLSEKGLITKGMRTQKAIQSLSSSKIEEYDYIVLCDILAASKSERLIIDRVMELQKGLLLLQKNEIDDELIYATYKDIISEKEEKRKDIGAKINYYTAHDIHSEIGLVSTIMRSIKNVNETVIVVPRTQSVIPLISIMGNYVKEFNVSMGYPIVHSTFVTLCEKIFIAQETKRSNAYYAKDYLNLMQHPILKNYADNNDPHVSRAIVHTIEEHLCGITKSVLKGSLFVKIDQIENSNEIVNNIKNKIMELDNDAIDCVAIRDRMKKLHCLAFNMWESVDTCDEFARVFESFIHLLIKETPLQKYPVNVSAAKIILHVVERMTAAEYRNERFQKKELFDIIRQLLHRKKIAFSGMPIQGLQILGLLETRSIQFENVIVLDLNEGVLPEYNKYYPLIPREILYLLDIAIVKNEVLLQRHNLFRLISSAKNVHLIYIANNVKERSRFIEELLWIEEKKKRKLGVEKIKRGEYPFYLEKRMRVISKNDEMLHYLKTEFVYSPSSLNTYLNCPLQFYYKYVLHLKEKENIEEEPEAREIGIFLHSFLEEIYEEFVGKKIEIDEVFIKKYWKTFQVRYDNAFANRLRADGFTMYEAMCYWMDKMIENDKKCHNGNLLIALEKEIYYKKEINSINYNFVAKIDRIDQLRDGSLLILDYKTGGSAKMPMNVEKYKDGVLAKREDILRTLRSFQLPLYLDAVREEFREEKIEAALYHLRPTGISYLSDAVNEHSPFSKTMQMTNDALCLLFKDLFDKSEGFNAKEEKDHACSFCPFESLCDCC